MHPLLKFRQDNSLTQPELARRLRISTGYVSLLEAGQRQASPKLALRVEKTLGIPRAHLRPDLWG